MKMLYLSGALVGLALLSEGLAVNPRTNAVIAAGPALISSEQVEADWLRQDQVRSLPARGKVSSQEDAAGGCDGVKDGRWGFHTGGDKNPWWQVDLGKELPLGQVLIYNRCDDASERALRLAVLLSVDGESWTNV